MNKKLLSFLLVVLFGVQSLQALTGPEVVEIATVGASVSSTVVYWFLTEPLGILVNPFELNNWKWSELKGYPVEFVNGDRNPKGKAVPLWGGAGTFVGSYAFFSWIASKYTAPARYKWVNKKLRVLEREYLYNTLITNDNLDEVLQISGCEASELPLVAAFLEVKRYDQQLVRILRQLDKAINDAGYSLRQKLRKQQSKATKDLLRIRNNESVIKNSNQGLWIEQWRIHQQRELELARIHQQALQTHVVWHI